MFFILTYFELRSFYEILFALRCLELWVDLDELHTRQVKKNFPDGPFDFQHKDLIKKFIQYFARAREFEFTDQPSLSQAKILIVLLGLQF